MTGTERLYYALGHLAYAVARADGKINGEERQKLHDIVVKESKCHNYNINVSEIIFHILDKEKVFDSNTAYQFALEEMKLCSNYLTDDMRTDFHAVLEKVARAFHPITAEEQEYLVRFRKDLELI